MPIDEGGRNKGNNDYAWLMWTDIRALVLAAQRHVILRGIFGYKHFT
jgi:hypothetical protein